MGWRKQVKECILTAFENECGICGYNKCNEALEFHHMIPEKKDFSISSFKIENTSNIVCELKKCICVCGKCHREIHNGLLEIPDTVRRYNTKKSSKIVATCKSIYDKMIEKKHAKLKKKKRRYRNKNVN